MFRCSEVNKRFAFAAMAFGMALAVSCSSNNNNAGGNANKAVSNTAATQAATQAATRAATPATTASAGTAGSPAAAAAGSAAAGGAVAMTFQPPGGSAAWSNNAEGCHGAKAPAGAEAPKASDTGVTPTDIKLGSAFGLTGPGSVYAPIIKVIQACFNAINADGGIYGRKLNLQIEDDQYSPANTPPR